MTHTEKALALFPQYYHCSQSVFSAFADELGISEQTAQKIGACFGSGMCKGEVCGACTGALMVLGMKYTQADDFNADARKQVNDLTKRFLDMFAEENGSYLCRELLGYNLGVPEEAAAAKAEGLFRTFCPKMVASAVKIVEKIMLETDEESV